MDDRPPIDDLGELTLYIEKRYHERHRKQLPALIVLAVKVEATHAADPAVPRGLADLLARMLDGIEDHLHKEEVILFPMIREGGPSILAGPIAMMRAEHDDHWADSATIRSITNDMTAPDHACRSWIALMDGLREFVTDLEEHIRLENEVLFPPFEKI